VSVLFVLVPVALLLVVVFVAAYAWSSRSGQFDDLTTPAMRVLHDEPVARPDAAPGEAGAGVRPEDEPPAAR
jgi:cbb3-type cytochrome oxidase maturation protein